MLGAVMLAGIALVLEPMLGHAGAMGGRVGTTLIASEVMHLLAAGAWLGGLLPLFITIGTLPHNAAATACRSFTPVGLSAVLVLGGTAVLQVTDLMGGMPGLFGTGYGHVALVKVGLFFVLLALAALNRLALTDRLAGAAAQVPRGASCESRSPSRRCWARRSWSPRGFSRPTHRARMKSRSGLSRGGQSRRCSPSRTCAAR